MLKDADLVSEPATIVRTKTMRPSNNSLGDAEAKKTTTAKCNVHVFENVSEVPRAGLARGFDHTRYRMEKVSPVRLFGLNFCIPRCTC